MRISRLSCGKKEPDRFSCLPAEVLMDLAEHLGAKDLIRLQGLNRRLYDFIAKHEALLAQQICHRYGTRVRNTINLLCASGINISEAFRRYVQVFGREILKADEDDDCVRVAARAHILNLARIVYYSRLPRLPQHRSMERADIEAVLLAICRRYRMAWWRPVLLSRNVLKVLRHTKDWTRGFRYDKDNLDPWYTPGPAIARKESDDLVHQVIRHNVLSVRNTRGTRAAERTTAGLDKNGGHCGDGRVMRASSRRDRWPHVWNKCPFCRCFERYLPPVVDNLELGATAGLRLCSRDPGSMAMQRILEKLESPGLSLATSDGKKPSPLVVAALWEQAVVYRVWSLGWM